MSVLTRPFAQDTFNLILTRTNSQGRPGAYLTDLVTVFTSCRFRGTTQTVNKRATWEANPYPLPIEIGYNITVGGVLDASYPNLIWIFTKYGAGPYWLILNLEGLQPLYAQGIITEAGIGTSGEVYDQDLQIAVRGEFT